MVSPSILSRGTSLTGCVLKNFGFFCKYKLGIYVLGHVQISATKETRWIYNFNSPARIRNANNNCLAVVNLRILS